MLAVSGQAPFTVDLQTQRISGPGGPDIGFDIPAADRMRLIEGLDDIGLTLKHADEIAAWEQRMAVDAAVVADGGGQPGVMAVPALGATTWTCAKNSARSWRGNAWC